MLNKELIQAAGSIKTPLSFLALVIIITEGILLYLAQNAQGVDFTILVAAMALLPFMTLGVFYFMFKSTVRTRTEEGHNAAARLAEFASERLRKEDKPLPDISGLQGTWKSTWYLEGDKEPYVEDHVWIEGIKENKVQGHGEDEKGLYNFEGFYERGVLTLVYKYVDRGYSLAGVIVLEVGALSKKAEGKWYGYLIEGKINGGSVEWEKLSENIIEKSDLQ